MLKKRWLKKEAVKAVHENDLNNLLVSLGIFEDIVAGHHTCVFCSCPINLENIGAIVPEGGGIKVICENVACIYKLGQAEG